VYTVFRSFKLDRLEHGPFSRSVQNLDLHQMDCTGLGWPDGATKLLFCTLAGSTFAPVAACRLARKQTAVARTVGANCRFSCMTLPRPDSTAAGTVGWQLSTVLGPIRGRNAMRVNQCALIANDSIFSAYKRPKRAN
jgi:hypothetical protein